MQTVFDLFVAILFVVCFAPVLAGIVLGLLTATLAAAFYWDDFRYIWREVRGKKLLLAGLLILPSLGCAYLSRVIPPDTPPTPPPTTLPTPVPTPIPTPRPTPSCTTPEGPFTISDVPPRRFADVDGAVQRVRELQPQLFEDGRLKDWEIAPPSSQVQMADIFYGFTIEQLRQAGFCAVLWGDAIGVRSGDLWEEYHIVNFGGGGIAEARFAFRNVFSYGTSTPPRQAACPLPWGPGRWVESSIENIGRPPVSQLLSVETKWCSDEDRTSDGRVVSAEIWAFDCGTKCCRISAHEGELGVSCQKAFYGVPIFSHGPEIRSVMQANAFNLKIAEGEGLLKACGTVASVDRGTPCEEVFVRAQVGPVVGR